MPDFIECCPGCGTCAVDCPFLAEFGTPDKILANHPDAAFYCTSCRRCEAVCPLGLSPATAFQTAKQQMVQENQLSPSVRKVLNSAKTFVKTSHRFPFSFYDNKETVFWPGCGLPAIQPELIRKIQKTLSIHLQQKVGLILDCCHDPLFQLGDIRTTYVALQEIQKRLYDGGVKKVITGCLNCHKLLSEHLDGIQVVFILEALPPEAFQSRKQDKVYLHHPCPSLYREEIRNAAQKAVNHIYPNEQSADKDSKSANDLLQTSTSLCCGLGGGLRSLHPKLADRFLELIIQNSYSGVIATYCTGCQKSFLKRGVEAVHLLECLPEAEPCRSVPSPLRQWLNRLILAARLKFNIAKFLLLLCITLLVAGGAYLNSQHIFSAEALKNLLEQHPVLAPVIFLGVYAVAPALFLPSIPITLAAGFFWGPVWGVVFSITGATIGACLPFFLSRYLLHDFIKNMVTPERWEWLQDRVNQHGWKAVAFTRLIPVFPFNLLNYLFGLTPVSFIQYLWSTFVFMLPACIAFVAFGSSLAELIIRGNFKGVITGITITVIAFLVPFALRPFFRKIGNKDIK